MHLIQEIIGVPKIKPQKSGDTNATFVIEPLPQGYGMTLGNTLRRVLISSLPGTAVTGVKIKGVTHEYSAIKGVKDSVLDIILNLKLLQLKKSGKEVSTLTLKTNKAGVVTAKDIKTPSDVSILNPDQYITTLSDGGKIEMEIKVEKGLGYRPATLKKKDGEDAQMINVDAFFSPVKKVQYKVENTRVGQMTDLDKLTITIETNGALTPEEAIKFSSNLLTSYFSLFNEENVIVEEDFQTNLQKIAEKTAQEEVAKPKKEEYTPIEILGLSPRTLNALINGGIGSIEILTKTTESKLSNLRGFGKKALNEVKDALAKRNLSLSEDE